MEADMIEKKVHYLGAWNENRVDNGVIAEINSKIQNEKGNKVKLQLSHDGLRVVKNTMIQGRMLQDFIPVEKIQFLTVSQRMPDLLIVIALSRDQGGKRFQVQAFRCANGMDAGIYMNAFRKVQRAVKTVTVVKTSAPPKNENEINWTLRSKEHDNSKRELKKLVDLHGEKAILHKTTENHATVIPNGHTEVYETGVRIPLYRKGRPTRIESTQSAEDESALDSRSEVSESALRQELDSLSQELRDIKLMLEQSTGITAGSEPGSPRDFRQMNVDVHKHTVSQPETVVVRRTEPEESVQVVVIDDDDVQLRPKKGGYFTTTTGNTTHVRVSVPDYRSKAEEEHTSKVEDTGNDVTYRVTKVNSGYVTDTSRETRPSTMSYASWKQNSIPRNAVVYKDIPERVQWKSRPTRQSHVVSTRTRSTIPSFSEGGQIQVRHHSAGYGPSYQRQQRVSHVHSIPRDRKSHSLRTKGLSTTVARPIERVYTGRPDAKHHSLVMRQVDARPSILVKDGSVRGSQMLEVEQNNNVVKVDTNDDNLLDVTGMDLYNTTPVEVTVTGGEIIRT